MNPAWFQVWDGLNTRGSLVPDGDYTLRLLGAGGKMLGDVLVTLDTNRSSVMKAVDTPFALYTNLTCGINWDASNLTLFTGDEDKAFLNVKDGNGSPPDGLYSVLLDGAERSMCSWVRCALPAAAPVRPLTPKSRARQ